MLANVLDINDDFGVIGGGKKGSLFNRNSNYRSKMGNDQYGTNTMSQQYQIYLKRENSNLSQSGAENLNESSFLNNKTDVNLLRKNLGAILKEIRLITQKLKDDEDDESKSLNWKFAAMVIDRLCMVTFSFATLISTILILFTSENIFKPSDPSLIF